MAAHLTAIEGQSEEAAVWDAEFELWLASAISRRLAEHPAPPDTSYLDDARAWAENLGQAGREALNSLGVLEPLVRGAAGYGKEAVGWGRNGTVADAEGSIRLGRALQALARREGLSEEVAA